MIDGFPIFIAMGLRRARSLLQDFVSYTKIQPKFKQMFMSNKLNCFKQAELKKFPWVTYLKTSSPWDNIHVLTRQNWQNVDQLSWITIKKFYYKVEYEIFYESATAYFITKCNVIYNWFQTATAFFFVLLQSATGFINIATRITKRDDYYRLQQYALSSTFLLRPSLPLSLKACCDCMQRRKCFAFKFVCAYLV